jgi:hypothetical protein
MKVLPCQTSACKGGAGNRSALARQELGYAVVVLPGGAAYTIGRVSSFPLVVKCAGCKGTSTFTAAQFNGLPDLTVGQMQVVGALDLLTKDWEGYGLNRGQATQTIAAGYMGPGSLPDR